MQASRRRQHGLSARILRPRRNSDVSIRFTAPATVVVLAPEAAKTESLMFATPHSTVRTDELVTAQNEAGSLEVSVAARSWETLSQPVRVSWFVAGGRAQALVQPAPGISIEPTRKLELTFPVSTADILGTTLPKLVPATPGHWTRPAANSLAFQPSGFGFGLGTHVSVVLPISVTVENSGRSRTTSELTWSVPQGRTLRLQQLLAGLGYLPLIWKPTASPVPDDAVAQTEAALKPPAGTFAWRYPNTPAQLQSLWNADTWTTMTQGAVMAFEHDQGLTVDGLAGPDVWRALLKASTSGTGSTHGNTYVLVHRTVPQTLELWHDGQVILRTLVNTGVPGAPTPYGTHAVFLHIASGTMSGRNPDGSHYRDPNIPWISYFNGGEAIHGFNRGSYGFPQSVGCVETAIPTAARIWPYTTIGTLVTIVP